MPACCHRLSIYCDCRVPTTTGSAGGAPSGVSYCPLAGIILLKFETIDWVIMLATLLLSFVPALFFAQRSNKNSSEFFLSNRSVPWALAGLSMVATTFSSDTPNLVADIVRRQGVAGNWCWWAFALTGLVTVFFYARLWRRSEVMTDLEFYELRYSGKAAGMVRGFRAIYLGLFYNCIIMATVNLAACKIAAVLFGMSRLETLAICGILNVFFAAHSGLWGVLVIDMIQFFIKMAAVIAAAYFAVMHVGGLDVLVEKLNHPQLAPDGKHVINYLNVLPDFNNNWDMAVAIFIMPLAVQWWSVWYPGSEPGGGSYMAQRMLASKTEKDSLSAVLFFNVVHYVVRPWPWILVALCSLLVYPQLSDIQKAFPNLDPSLLGHDIAYPAMLKFLPAGFVGLMAGGLIAANSSTILTHLNWGASYLVHDFYQRFIKKEASEKNLVLMGRLATVFLFVLACLLTFVLDSAKDAFDIILQIGAGTGLLYLLRWYWWRINAYSEIAAMVSSFLFSVAILILRKNGFDIGTDLSLILTVAFTTVCWVLTAYIAPPTEQQVLIDFYKKVKPPGPGWNFIKKRAEISDEELKATHDSIPKASLACICACAFIWSSLFAIGNLLYSRVDNAMLLAATAAVSGRLLGMLYSDLWKD